MIINLDEYRATRIKKVTKTYDVVEIVEDWLNNMTDEEYEAMMLDYKRQGFL